VTGSLAAGIQSAVYGASTGGIFSVFQSIGVTAVVAPPAALVLGAVAIGTGIVLSSRGRKNTTEGGGSSDDIASSFDKDECDDDDYDEDDFTPCRCSSCSVALGLKPRLPLSERLRNSISLSVSISLLTSRLHIR
jgi:hypothetical protein